MPFVVALVTACEDLSGGKLKKCLLDVGGDEPLTVVTNASNVREGTRTCVALVGTEVEDVLVKKTSVGGVMSEGMLCDAKMLNWTSGAHGLCVQVPDSFKLGDPAPLSKPRLDGGVTPAAASAPVKSDKELKAEAKAAKKAEQAAKKEARRAKKGGAAGKEGDDDKDDGDQDEGEGGGLG
jgi:tRNA-binding EMAP/Myf-like protein